MMIQVRNDEVTKPVADPAATERRRRCIPRRFRAADSKSSPHNSNNQDQESQNREEL
jgi:hypothetical protein